MVLFGLLLTPFAYASVFGIRIVLVQALFFMASAFFYFLRSGGIYKNNSSILFLIMICIAFFYGVSTGLYRSFYASCIFFVLTYWICFFSGHFHILFLMRLVKIYIWAVILTSISLILQVFLFLIFGLDLFDITIFGGGRLGFKLNWSDYSFLSLYLVSVIPMVHLVFSSNFKFFVISILLFSSLATSARTGIASIFIFIIGWTIFEIFKSIYRGRIKKKLPIALFSVFMAPIIVLYLLPLITGRELSSSSSGRFEGFLHGLEYFMNNPFFGAMFDSESYLSHVSTVPHNIFIYFLTMGGGMFYFFWILWGVLIIREIRFADLNIIYSLVVMLIGFQFIPSFFSAYFFCLTLSIAILSSAINYRYYRLSAR